MLKNIKQLLKTMGEALTFADAGEMLTAEQKAKVLGRHAKSFPMVPDAVPPRVILAGDEELAPESVERAIVLCREKSAMLDLLCVSRKAGSATIDLATVLPRLEAEPGLDFQVTRRQGDLLAVTEHYLRARQDTLTVLINVSGHLRKQAEHYPGTGFHNSGCPAVELIGDAILA